MIEFYQRQILILEERLAERDRKGGEKRDVWPVWQKCFLCSLMKNIILTKGRQILYKAKVFEETAVC